MILLWLILIPFLAGIFAWIFAKFNFHLLARWTCLIALGMDLTLGLTLWCDHNSVMAFMNQGQWLQEFQLQWIPQLGINFYLAMDGLSLLMVILTAFLGLIAILASWTEIEEHVGFFHFNLMWIIAGVMGVFLSLDLFLFYFFWEMMLIPMYLLIGIWGHENRIYASVKFFIFTQAGGMLMLLSLLGLYFAHYQQTGFFSFQYADLLKTTLSPRMEMFLMLGLFVGFAVKLPVFPFHTWLPDAHTEAPTAGSVILAGVLLKTGAYGLLRFVLPIFPNATQEFSLFFMTLGVIGALYGAVLAFAQTDIKRLVAYSSVSHMGLVLVGIFARTELSLQGAVIEMICHGLSTGGLFLLAGTIQECTHTRNIERLGGLFTLAPRMGVIGIFFAMASLGLPGLGNFVGEFLVLFGSFTISPTTTVVATVGLVAGTIYSLWIIQKVFHGEPRESFKIPDFSFRHLMTFGSMMIALVWIGLNPQPVINTAAPMIQNLRNLIVLSDVLVEPTASKGHSPTRPFVANVKSMKKPLEVESDIH